MITQKDAQLAKATEEISRLTRENEKLHLETTTALNKLTTTETTLTNAQTKLLNIKASIEEVQNIDLKSIVRNALYDGVPDLIKDKIADLIAKINLISA